MFHSVPRICSQATVECVVGFTWIKGGLDCLYMSATHVQIQESGLCGCYAQYYNIIALSGCRWMFRGSSGYQSQLRTGWQRDRNFQHLSRLNRQHRLRWWYTGFYSIETQFMHHLLLITLEHVIIQDTLRQSERHSLTPGSAARHSQGPYWQNVAGLCGRHSGISSGACLPSPVCTCACISLGGTSKAWAAAFSERSQLLLPTYLYKQLIAVSTCNTI